MPITRSTKAVRPYRLTAAANPLDVTNPAFTGIDFANKNWGCNNPRNRKESNECSKKE